jgi:hypothetical protein
MVLLLIVLKRLLRSVNILFIVLKSRSIVVIPISAHKNILAANDNGGYMSLIIPLLTNFIHYEQSTIQGVVELSYINNIHIG